MPLFDMPIDQLRKYTGTNPIPEDFDASSWENIEPYWLGEAGCDLSKKDDYSQYTPSNPPSN